MSPDEMQRDIHVAQLGAALDLANFSATDRDGLRSASEIATECIALSITLKREGVNEPARGIAADGARVLESLASRFREAGRLIAAGELS
jgi:hypothetical protein